MNKIPFPFPVTPSRILAHRAMILASLCAADDDFCRVPVRAVRQCTLAQMLRLYDELFFSCFLSRFYVQIDVTLSSRLTSSAGKFIYSLRRRLKKNERVEIRMSSDFLQRLDQGPFDLNGLSAATPQEAFLIVFEHELCHAIEYAIYGETGHSRRFLALANGLFGHTATRHSLPTRKQEAAEYGLVVGCRAAFLYQGASLCGRVTYVGKTATVMVPDKCGNYSDRAGVRYTKYRVPLGKLSLV